MLFLTILIVLASGNSIMMEYRFANNFGQVFYDYSGNGYHAVNGESSLDTINDTFPTDRGAYFGYLVQNQIKLPPNNLVSSYYSINQSFSASLWVLVGDFYNSVIFLRYSGSNTIKIKRDASNSSLWIRRIDSTDDTTLYLCGPNSFPACNN
jgi:hypothetical protein